MGNIDSFVDMTGAMSQDDINTENINNIIDELYRNSDQLDSISNTLSIIAYGTLDYSWDGSGSGATPTQSSLFVPATSSANFIGMTYFSRSTDDPTIYFAMPYTQGYVNANGDSVVGKLFVAGSNSDTGQYEIDLNFYNTGTPIDYTFYYILLQQPSNVTSN